MAHYAVLQDWYGLCIIMTSEGEFTMKLMMYLPAASLAFMALTDIGAQEAPTAAVKPLRNAIYASPMSMIINSAFLEFPVISIAYERSLNENGLSLMMPFHVGWLENEREKDVTIGAGLGIRKYFGHAFAGSYLTAQTDYLHHYTRGIDYSWSINADVPFQKTDYLSVSQLAFGYKWLWQSFTLDLSGGGAFYAQDKEKYTSFIASANVGFPFSSESFGF